MCSSQRSAAACEPNRGHAPLPSTTPSGVASPPGGSASRYYAAFSTLPNAGVNLPDGVFFWIIRLVRPY